MTDALVDNIALATNAVGRQDDELRKYFYGDVTLCGTFRPTLTDFDRTQPTPYGLSPLYQAWYAIARGESGDYYNAQRFNHVMMVPRLHLTRSAAGAPAVDAPEARNSFYGYTSNDIVDGQWVVSSRGKPDRAMRFAATPGESARWTEANILELQLDDPAGLAMQMYHPDPEHSFYYIGIVTKIEGEILGDRVEGIGGYELAWADGALEWREMPIAQRLEEHWILYVIEYADGGYDVASMYTTHDGRGSGHRVTEDGCENLAGVRSDFERRDDGLPARITWEHAGRRWYADTETASTTSPRNPSYIWQLGQCRQEGVDREIRSSWTFCETLGRAYAVKGWDRPDARSAS